MNASDKLFALKGLPGHSPSADAETDRLRKA